MSILGCRGGPRCSSAVCHCDDAFRGLPGDTDEDVEIPALARAGLWSENTVTRSVAITPENAADILGGPVAELIEDMPPTLPPGSFVRLTPQKKR